MLMRNEEVCSEQLIDETEEGQEGVLIEAHSHDAVVTNQSEPPEPAPHITSRFLFVNVAGPRAKQLRRGAIARFEAQDAEQLWPRKAERVAMEEVRRGLVYWELPEGHPVTVSEAAPAPQRPCALREAQ